ncbi:hypothetical protein J5Y04_16480 [Kitasatospora sp. RG8]|nr:hypothetical protein [Kitasatospora sp. RG8]MBP0451126.1 hypothetical protein [Kitasatospora sp. RG8]
MVDSKHPVNMRRIPVAIHHRLHPGGGEEMERQHAVSLRPRLDKIKIKSAM